MKICIEIPSWIGDSVMTTPSIINIVNFFQHPEITIIGQKSSIALFKNFPRVISLIEIDKSYKNIFYTIQNLNEYDTFISYRKSLRSSFLKSLIKAKKKFQYDRKLYVGHQVEKYNSFVCEIFNFNLPPGPLSIYPFERSLQKRLRLGINPGASYGSAKRWYPDKFAKVIENLSDKYEVIIFGSKNEIEIAEDIEKNLKNLGIKNYQNLVGKTSIEELIFQVRDLSIFITGDSGIMHIAAAFSIPTVAIFGPTITTETSQWMNPKSLILKKNLDCQPCMKRVCPLGHHDCMKKISSKEVIDSVLSLT